MDINTLLSDISSAFHGTTTNKIPNIYGHINRAARQVIQDVDPKETQRIVQLGSQLFDDVYDYPCPVDLKGDRIIDLRLQAGRLPFDVFTQGYAQNFDANKSVSFQNKIYTQWNTGVKTLRVEAPTLITPTTLTSTGTITGWTATPGAQNISLDTNYNVAGGGAIQFDLAAGNANGSIQISTLNPTDLTSLVNIGTGFVWVYLPTAASITSIDVAWGSSSSNYYHSTLSTTQQGTVFQNGWNLLSLPWVSATKVGTPVNTTYSFVKCTVNYNSTLQTGVKFCNLMFAPGYIFELQYYSKYLFRNPSTNAFVEKIVDVTQNAYLINLDTDSYNILFNKTAFFIAQALQGADAEYDATYWDAEYQNALMRYKGLNPSETMLKGSSYYNLPRRGYRNLNRPFTNGTNQ